jgi:dephospho-CoA kinase
VRLTDRVLMVGLTGGIGAGKSEVTRCLADLGAVVVDADRLAREVVEPGTPGLAEVVAAFGRQVLGPDGALDRPTLGRLVFADEAARRRLEAIVHPRVRERTAALVAAAPPDAVVVNDVPLLVEAGLAGGYDLVVVVLAPRRERLRRLVEVRGMAEAEASSRIAAQADDARRRAVADVVIVNDGTRAELRERVAQVWRDRLAPYAADPARARPAAAAARAAAGQD